MLFKRMISVLEAGEASIHTRACQSGRAGTGPQGLAGGGATQDGPAPRSEGGRAPSSMCAQAHRGVGGEGRWERRTGDGPADAWCAA